MATSTTAKPCMTTPVFDTEYMLEPSVAVTVGPDEASSTFYLPPGLLKSVSGYFKGCLSGNFSESNNNGVRLKDTDPAVFRLFVGWLFGDTEVDEPRDINTLLSLWIFADYAVCEMLQNRVMDRIRALFYANRTRLRSAPLWVLNKVAEQTREQSALQKYFLDNIAFGLSTQQTQMNDIVATPAWDKLPLQTTKNLLIRYDEYLRLREQRSDPSLDKSSCAYHVHEHKTVEQTKVDSPTSTLSLAGSTLSSTKNVSSSLNQVATSATTPPVKTSGTSFGFGA